MNGQHGTLQLTIPAELVAHGMTPRKIETKWLEWAVMALFRDEVISSGRAAELLNITRTDFIALLGRNGFAYLDQSADELTAELNTLDALGL